MAKKRLPLSIIDIMPEFKMGDPPPTGYLEWHEWAEVQTKAGLRQSRCERCKRWLFPQEVDIHVCDPSRLSEVSDA